MPVGNVTGPIWNWRLKNQPVYGSSLVSRLATKLPHISAIKLPPLRGQPPVQEGSTDK